MSEQLADINRKRNIFSR